MERLLEAKAGIRTSSHHRLLSGGQGAVPTYTWPRSESPEKSLVRGSTRPARCTGIILGDPRWHMTKPPPASARGGGCIQSVRLLRQQAEALPSVVGIVSFPTLRIGKNLISDQAGILTDGAFDLGGDIRIGSQEAFGIFATLADALTVVGKPGP